MLREEKNNEDQTTSVINSEGLKSEILKSSNLIKKLACRDSICNSIFLFLSTSISLDGYTQGWRQDLPDEGGGLGSRQGG